MRTYIDIKDISDSREVLEAKPVGFSRTIVYIALALIASCIIWSLIAYKEITVNVKGMIRPAGDISKVTLKIQATVEQVKVKDGDVVKKGDVLFIMDSREVQQRKQQIEKEIKEKDIELEALNKLKKCVEDNGNLFDKRVDSEVKYYDKYESIKKDLQDGSTKRIELAKIEDTISRNQEANTSFKKNLDNITYELEQYTIKANSDGQVILSKDIYAGELLQPGIEAASIVPKDNLNYFIEGYIPSYSAYNVNKDQNVNIVFPQISGSKLSSFKTKISNISSDAKIDQQQGISYFTLNCPISQQQLGVSQQEFNKLKLGMTCDVKIVQRKLKFFDYFLEKINLKHAD